MLTFLIARLSSLPPCRRRTQLGSLHYNASHIFNSFSSVLELSKSNQPKQNQKGDESFTVSYLMNSCGLPLKVAIEVSKRVNLKDPDNPDSVLDLFRSSGFSETQISKLVEKCPRVLLAKPENNLLPKLRFFQSIGFSCSGLSKLLISSRLLTRSLKNCIIPRYEVLKSILDDEEKVNLALKRSGWIFLERDVLNVVPNIKILREHGVPQSSVSQLVTSFASLAFMKHEKFVEHIKFVKDIGIKPSKSTFIQAIYVSAATKKPTWETKLDIYERCGWSRDVTLSVFRKYPFCMLLSEDKITSSMKFLVEEMCVPLDDIAKCPSFLGYNLNRRIIRRCSMVKILKMKGLVSNDRRLSSIIKLSEKEFLEKFVIRFQKSVPQLLNIYNGPLGPLPEVQ